MSGYKMIMNIIALVLMLAAAILFTIAGIYRPAVPVWLTNIGLALLTVGLMVQFGAKTHAIVF